MNVGSVHWVELPAVNGHEQHGRRPAVILQSDSYAANLPVVIVVPLTSSRKSLRFAGTTLVKATSENGLRQTSVALVFQLRAIDRARIKEQLGTLSPEQINDIFAELDKLTERSSQVK